MPRCARRRAAARVMSRPNSRIDPLSGASSPVMRLKSVVLPAPLGPMISRRSPGSTASATSRVTRSPPNDLQSASMTRAVMTALVIDALCKSFGGLRVTRDVALAVEPGERRLIIGPNGAGKTTLFNLITGELAPDGGSILLFDRDITQIPGRRRAHLGIGRTYQIITLFPRDTLLRNVTLALLGRTR